MSQEISIKLRADTRDAVRSVQDLEQQVNGLSDLQRRGEGNNLFLSEEDVKRFRRMSEDAEKVYKQFFDNYTRIQRDLERKKKELEQALRNNAGSSTKQQLQREIQELEARRQIYSSQQDRMGQLRNESQQRQGSIQDMNSPGALGSLLMMSKRLLPMLGLSLGAGALFSFAKDGMKQIKVDEAYMSKLGQRVDGFNGDFEKGRLEAQAVGLKGGNAYTALETMQVAENYTSLAGAKNSEDMWKATNEIQTMSRVTGLDASELAQQAGTLSRWGAFDAGSLRGFQDAMVGAIKETGMAGRDREMVTAVTNLAERVAYGQLEYSNGEFNQVLGLQTMLGKLGDGFKGERGAEVLGNIDSGIKGGSSTLDLMLGFGTEFQGIEGRAELERMKSQGISNPENVKRIFSFIQNAGYSQDYTQLMLSDLFGISPEQAYSLSSKESIDMLSKGGYSEEEFKRMMESGAIEGDTRTSEWSDSQAQRRAENDANWENTKKYGGSPLDKVWEGAKEKFLSQPEALQWAEMGAVGLGGGLAAATMMKGLGTRIGGAPPAGGGLGSKIGSGVKSIGKGAGKLLAPVGAALSLGWAANAGGNFADYLFGHKEGDFDSGGLLGKSGVYEEDRQGALSKLFFGEWDTEKVSKSDAEAVSTGTFSAEAPPLLNSANTATVAAAVASPALKSSSSSSSVKEEKIARDARELQNRKESILTRELEVVSAQKSAIAAKDRNTDKERKNIQDLNNFSKSGGSATGGIAGTIGTIMKSVFGGALGGAGVGGVMGVGMGLLGGVASAFGMNSLSSGSTTSSVAGNSNEEKVWNYFKTKGFSDQAVAGILGNLKQESGVDPTKKQSGGGPGRGLMQWEVGGRWDTLTKYAKDSGRDPYALETQLDYMWKEMNGGDPTGVNILKNKYGGLDALKNTKSTKFATEAFEDSFERAGKPNYARRYQFSDDYLKKFQGTGSTTSSDVKSVWDATTASTASKATASSTRNATQNINVNVSGKIDGLTKENNDRVANAVIASVHGDNVKLAYEFRQGIGGNR